MGIVIEKYEDFTTPMANETIGSHFDEPITDVEIRGLGEGVGLMSSIARAHLTFESGRTGSVVVKAVARTANSALSKGLNFYRNEVNFFRYLADECPAPIPRPLYAYVDDATQDFLLVLEDLGEETAGDQLVGATEAQLNIVYQRAAELHAQFWNRTTDFPWLNYQVDMRTMLFRRDQIFIPGVEPAIEKFPHRFEGNRADVVRRITEQYLDLFSHAQCGPQTIVHGDYRSDNLFFTEENGKPDIIMFDWQNTMGGSGTHDIAYFGLGCIDAELRGDAEMRAIRHYHDTLTANGVKGFSFDECLERYRYNLLITLITPIAISGTLDQGNERGVQLGETMLERAFAALESLDCAALLR